MMKFSRQSRLLKPAEFKSVFQQAIRSGDDCFRIMARANGIQHHRLGMAVAKKACSRAVDRNRIKRVIRENFRTRIIGLKTVNTLDFVVLPNAIATKRSNKELNESLSTHWQRLIRKAGQRNNPDRPDQKRTD